MSHNVDTISVRADEKFDELKLSDFLKGKLEGSENPLHVRQFPGGKANLTYHLDYGSHEYVLRRPPLGPWLQQPMIWRVNTVYCLYFTIHFPWHQKPFYSLMRNPLWVPLFL